MSIPLSLKSLQVRNFLSFGNSSTEIDLSGSFSTLIIGENVDANSNNGAGKTTIINALCYVLYNKPFDNISLQRLINSTNGAKGTLMEVRLTFTKGDDEYEIYRCRGETYNIQISLNGADITLDSVAENDKYVQEIIGISYELFTKIVIFSGNSTPFLLMPVSQQRQQIEELFNITLLTEKAIKLKEGIKITEGDINIQEAVIKEQETALKLYKKHVTDANTRVSKWEDDRRNQIDDAKEQLELMSQVDMEEEKKLHGLVDELRKQERDLSNQKREHLLTNLPLAKEIKKLEEELKHLVDDKCPYCLQAYAGASDKLVEKHESLEHKKLKHVEGQQHIDSLDENIGAIKEKLCIASESLIFESLADAVKAEANAATAHHKITEREEAVNPHLEALDDLLNNPAKEVTYDMLNDLKRDLEHQQFLLKLLTDKNSFIRRRIINRTIPFLNKRLIYYTKQLGLPHIVRFDDDMSCSVSEYGRELDFGNLSSGEKKRVNLSLSLAFRDVLHHLHARVNCLFIDEIDASLDGGGVEAVFGMLKQKARDDDIGLWIISHRPEAIGRFDRQLIIRKQNGFSQVVDDEADG